MAAADELKIDLSPERVKCIKDAAHIADGPDFLAPDILIRAILDDQNLNLAEKGVLIIKTEQLFVEELVSEADFRIKTTPNHKHLLPDNLASGLNADNLIRELFKRNEKVALCDIHTSKEEHQYIIDKLKKWKKFGLELFAGCETTQTLQSEYDKICGIQNPEQRLRAYDLMRAEDAEFLKANPDNDYSKLTKDYNKIAEKTQDITGLNAIKRKVLAESIILGAADSPIERRMMQVSEMGNPHDLTAGNRRVAATNFDWPEAISKLEKRLSSKGKLIEFGGQKHFDNYYSGFVDELTGAPSIKFEPANERHPINSFCKSDDASFDYTIYIDDKSGAIASADINRFLNKIYHPLNLPKPSSTPDNQKPVIPTP